jgi:hypothetical protein
VTTPTTPNPQADELGAKLEAWAFNVTLECLGREEEKIDCVIGGDVLDLRDLHAILDAAVSALPSPEQTERIDALIDMIISTYHTTRLADVPAALHIRSRLGARLTDAIDAARITADSARIEVLEEALCDLQVAEAGYRYAHDHFGADDSRTGRAWDIMRRCGDAAREHVRTALTSGRGG